SISEGYPIHLAPFQIFDLLMLYLHCSHLMLQGIGRPLLHLYFFCGGVLCALKMVCSPFLDEDSLFEFTLKIARFAGKYCALRGTSRGLSLEYRRLLAYELLILLGCLRDRIGDEICTVRPPRAT